MFKSIIRLAMLAFLLIPVTVMAQTPVHLGLVTVDIWPEYDQPAVLVIDHIVLASDEVLPTTLVIHIPAGVQINAVAMDDPVKGLINAPYDSTVQGDWLEIKFMTSSLRVQVEYYAALSKAETTRHIVFEWLGDNKVDTLEINFLLPPAADHVEIIPSPTNTTTGQGGLTNYLIRTIAPPIGQPFTVTIDYQRQTDELSIASLPVEAVSTPGNDTPGHISLPLILPWVLGGIGGVLVAVGVIGYLGLKRSRQGLVKNNRKAVQGEAQTVSVYCSECGKRAQPGDVFCRTCGARLKREAQD
jgi:hypothetical protein